MKANFKLLCGLLLLVVVGATQAFPPAPHHTIRGMIRDEQGNPVTAADAEIIFETDSGVVITSPIVVGLYAGENYLLEVPMDAGISPDVYQPTALEPQVPFTISVRIGQQVFLPIEMVANYGLLGQAGKTTYLNLTLGVDSDGDGLPDAWELALIQALGLDGLGDVTPDGDADGDGLTNLQEYISGNYAFDNSDGFALQIVGMNAGEPKLEFLALRGRNYKVCGSVDLKSWDEVSFKVSGGNGAAQTSYYSEDVRTVRVDVPLLPDQIVPFAFFKLIVQ